MTRRKAPLGRSKVSSSNAAELLFEIGVEELPYQVIAPAMSALQEAAGRLLEEARLTIESINVYGTPRRLTLVISGLSLRQASAKKEGMGPSKAVGFDSQGQTTKAAIGFAAGQSLSV
jgi:glycyl-tRNA synthetase beta chain